VWLAVAIGLLVLAVALGLGVRWFFNGLSPRVDARRRARDDTYFFATCASGSMTRYRWLNRRLPASPRCRFCLAPFAGAGRVLGIKPSRKNPNFCMGCFEMAPIGAHDMEVGVLFADIRGFTAWCEGRDPGAAEHALNRFYALSTAVMADHDAIIDKLVGDEVMALFLTSFPSLGHGSRACTVMVHAAEELQRRLQADPEALPVGIGLNFGVARVGNVGDGPVKDFTAIGDVVNTAARLQACAQPRQIVMSDAVFGHVRDRYGRAKPMTLTVKGKTDTVQAHLLLPPPRSADATANADPRATVGR
jgi:adenylate cyclase